MDARGDAAAPRLVPTADEVEHARAFLRKWSLGRYMAASSKASRASEVLILSPRDTVRDAMAMLARRRVLSAPVLDERRAVFRGFVGVADVLAAFLRSDSRELLVVRAQIGPEPGQPGAAALQAPDAPGGSGAAAPPEFAEQQARLVPRCVIFIATTPTGSRALPLAQLDALLPGADGHLLFNADDPSYEQLSLLDLVESFFLHAAAPLWPTCHRVALCAPLSASGVLSVAAIVSQTDVVRFLMEHAARGALGPMANRSLEDLGLVVDPRTGQPRYVRVACT